jgi:hypothetical protein
MRKTTVLSFVLLAACHHAGAGEGTLQTPATPTGASAAEGEVKFSWSSGVDPSSGKIQASLPDGSTFLGTFLQVTATAEADDVGPYYDAWVGPTWGVGSPWYEGDMDGFVTEYSGRAVANLTSPEGTRMRCKFVLKNPATGLSDGATGQCQLSTGETVFDAEIKQGT